MDTSPGQPVPEGGASLSGPNEVRPQRAAWADFFAFRVMGTPALIRVVYLIGVVLITLAAIYIPLVGTATTVCQGTPDAVVCSAIPGALVGGILVGILVFILGQLWWRVLTELLMVIFGIHEAVRAIEGQSRR
jgi:hypothetical protein